MICVGVSKRVDGRLSGYVVCVRCIQQQCLNDNKRRGLQPSRCAAAAARSSGCFFAIIERRKAPRVCSPLCSVSSLFYHVLPCITLLRSADAFVHVMSRIQLVTAAAGVARIMTLKTCTSTVLVLRKCSSSPVILLPTPPVPRPRRKARRLSSKPGCWRAKVINFVCPLWVYVRPRAAHLRLFFS